MTVKDYIFYKTSCIEKNTQIWTVQSGGFQQKGAGSQLWGTGSLIGGSGSQTRGVGSEIRWDPQFNPCIRLSVHFLSTSARLPPSIHQLNIPIVLRLLQPSSLCFPQTLPTIQTILLTGTVSSEQILDHGVSNSVFDFSFFVITLLFLSAPCDRFVFERT